MRFSRTFLLTLLFLFASLSFSQTTAEPTGDEKTEAVRKAALAFLRETYSDIGNMRSLENRISFTSELAALLWYHDQKEASAMFNTAVNDFKQLLVQYDGMINSLEADENEGGGGGGFLSMVEPSDRMIMQRRFRTAMAVRQQIAMNIAEHEPELAFNFFYDSISVVTNPQMRTELEGRDRYFEHQLLKEIAETNAAKAAELGKRSIDGGVNYLSIELLKKIYSKDADKGIEFGAALLSKIKSPKKDFDGDSVLSGLLGFGIETRDASGPGKKKPVYSDAELKELAELLARSVLDPSNTYANYSAHAYASMIEKVLPARAAQIRARYKVDPSSDEETAMINAMSAAVNTAGNAQYSTGNVNTNSSAGNNAAREEQERLEEELSSSMKKVGQRELPKEEREIIIARAREILMRTPGRERKLMGISMLAAQVRNAGDQELASELMRDAASLVNANPRNYQDFIYTWMLIAGYAEADPERAFPLLEDSIIRANELIASFVRVGEFIDVTGEMIVDGEVQVGAFGGEMIRGLTREIGIAESTLKTLVFTDFDKTKAVANRVERPEVRVLAKVLILRSALSKPRADTITIDDLSGQKGS